jgi:hypothetical protein
MSGWEGSLSNPIVILTALIVISNMILVGAAILGIDKNVLPGMARMEYARGLITYLFAIATIGIAVAVVLEALVGPIPADPNGRLQTERLQAGKDVLSLLLGVFGTIVGFYFGSTSPKSSPNESPGNQLEDLRISTLDLAPQPASPRGTLTVRAVVRGGSPPYKFGLAQGADAPQPDDMVSQGGWIAKEIVLKDAAHGESPRVRVLVQDTSGKRAEQTATVRLNKEA